MQGRVAAEMKDPIMRGLAYGLGGYVGMSFIYSLTNKERVKAAPKPAESHAAPAAEHHAAPAAAHAPQTAVATVADHAVHSEAAGKQQVAPVLHQLSAISDRLTKIEKALGI